MPEERDPYIGFWTPERCPEAECAGHLMKNAMGNKWCTTCSYHVHDGKRVDTRDDTRRYRNYRGGRREY